MITVGISDMKLIKGQGTLITYALGSCVGICLYDAPAKTAGLIHILLPSAPQGALDNAFKYADTAISETVSQMQKMGASRTRLIAKIAGGAKMFSVPGNAAFGNIGERNVEMVLQVLRGLNIPVRGQEVGGTIARTLAFDAENGSARIRSMGRAEIEI